MNYLQLFLSFMSAITAGAVLYGLTTFIKTQRSDAEKGISLTALTQKQEADKAALTLKQDTDKLQLQKSIDEVKQEVRTSTGDIQRTLVEHGQVLAVLKDRSDRQQNQVANP